MSEYERGYREALDAAAQIADGWGWSGQMEADAYARITVADEASRDTADAIATAIRALAPRIPPAPDDGAMVETVAHTLWEHGAMRFAPWCEANALERQGYVAEARAVLDALREAGALR